jgi:hypothetical protein
MMNEDNVHEDNVHTAPLEFETDLKETKLSTHRK